MTTPIGLAASHDGDGDDEDYFEFITDRWSNTLLADCSVKGGRGVGGVVGVLPNSSRFCRHAKRVFFCLFLALFDPFLVTFAPFLKILTT